MKIPKGDVAQMVERSLSMRELRKIESWSSLFKRCGSHGVRKVKKFNVALLVKWCWQLKTERGGLWRQVLTHKYEEVRGEIDLGGKKASTWWKDIDSISKGLFNEIDNWFEKRLFRKLGSREDSLFWDDPLLGEGGGVLEGRVGARDVSCLLGRRNC
ncbi:DNA-directed RNA polymerase [Trifolium pratense]|uniref:DNA-directed RNA polymerase n=1 Tax=Trifolium pratense TaxID=57577 RepID=A0A2K3NFS5_TRIPR|nr:DNA-directed RNA polymerase [Trifolium pratense]